MSNRKAFLLRINPQHYAALQAWADDELRSLNGQLEFLLRQALKQAGRLPETKTRKRNR
ncbi:MAG: Arc family DNA binding domain-containing protein [bacterium]